MDTNIKELIEENYKYKKQLYFLAETTGSVFWEFDFNTNLFIFNDFYYSFLKTTIEFEKTYKMNIEQYFESFIPKSSQKITRDIMGEVFQKDSDYYFTYEYQMIRRDGVILEVLVNGYVSYDKDGKPEKAYGTKHDLTKQKSYEDFLKQEKNKVESINKSNIKKLEQKDHILIQQARHAAMGEMIGNIAHQWRQPLNALGLIIQKIKLYQDQNILTTKNINKSITKGNMLINMMSTTIDDFRNFFKPNKVKVIFNIKNAINNCLSLIESSLEINNIKINKSNMENDIKYFGYKNEFEQALLNIIINAREILIAREIKNPKIHISLKLVKNKIVIKIIDNAGGISNDIINKIFDPYFTTKEQSNGTGIGLYMSKMIIEENIGGKLSVENYENGACFIIKLKRKDHSV